MSQSSTRREAIILTLSASTAAVLFPSTATAQEGDVQVEWRVLPEQVAAVKKRMPVRKVEAYDQRNPIVIGVVILVALARLPKIAQSVIDVYHRYKSGGVIIDTRTQPITISTNSRIPPGYALVISKDGAAQTVQLGGAEPATADDLAAILTAAIKKK